MIILGIFLGIFLLLVGLGIWVIRTGADFSYQNLLDREADRGDDSPCQHRCFVYGKGLQQDAYECRDCGYTRYPENMPRKLQKEIERGSVIVVDVNGQFIPTGKRDCIWLRP